MHETAPDIQGQDPHEREVDVLIGRLIDGEGGEADRQRFEHLAASEPTLWRQLAMQQQDHRRLAEEVEQATAAALRMELSHPWLLPGRITWSLALSGWAALVIVALSWGLFTLAGTPAPARVGPVTAAYTAPMTPEEHLRRYLDAPYVLGDLPPLVVEVDTISDGRIAVHFIRRIEEVALLDPDRELPLDADGELTRDPARLRELEPQVGFPN